MKRRLISGLFDSAMDKAMVGDVIYYKSGKLSFFSKDNIDQLLKPYAIAIVIGRLPHRLLILSIERGEKIVYSPTYVLVPGVTVATWDSSWNPNTQVDDLSGKANTDALVDYYGLSTSYAAGYCKSYNVANIDWYLGGFGEMKYVYNNLSVIDSVRSALGYKPLFHKIGEEVYTCLWSSTQTQNPERALGLRRPGGGSGYDPECQDFRKYVGWIDYGWGIFGSIVYPMSSIKI